MISSTNKINTREQWLNIAAQLMIDEIVSPVIRIETPLIRYSLTAPKTAQKKGVILGECWNREASTDNHNEIFITANMDNSLRILDVLLHEIIHAYDNNLSGHKKGFIDMCKLVGLKGGDNGRSKESFTCTEPTPQLSYQLKDIILDIGEIPHAKMNSDLSGKTKQKNRQLLVACTNCDFKFRASQKMIDSMAINTCLACCDDTLEIQSND
tara:strand:- start:178 stop:810 length:633 start_codon:yes stop_codon:yes gene_type:complete